MKIFLTGGSGMVGRTIQAHARRFDYEIDAPSRQQVDLMDAKKIQDYLVSTNPDLVIHAAGLVGGIQANSIAPYDFCVQNLQIGLNVIQAAHAAGIERLLNLGSSCMYPRDAECPLKETSLLTGALEPTNEGYAIAKLAVAKLAQYLSQQHEVLYKTLIPCNLYGPWDKFGVNNAHMLPAVIRKIHEAKDQGQKHVEVWGDGNARREFLFAEDLADFIFFGIERFERLPSLMNVGLGFDYSINDYYAAVKEVVGYSGGFKHNLSKPTGMQQKLVDISLQKYLGWKPKTDLTTGIARTYEFFLSRINEPCYH